MLLLIVILLVFLLVVGGPAVAWPNAGTWGWSPAGIVLVVLILLWLTGNLHL